MKWIVSRAAWLRCTFCQNDQAEWRVRVLVINSVRFMRLTCVECGGVLSMKVNAAMLKYLVIEGALADG